MLFSRVTSSVSNYYTERIGREGEERWREEQEIKGRWRGGGEEDERNGGRD